MHNLDLVVTTASELAKAVGVKIREVANSPEEFVITHKGRSDLVTEVDIWSEQLITETVQQKFPNHLIVGEETSADLVKRTGKGLEEIVSTGICWIVDPLDGTTNFSNRLPYCAVSIGIVEEGKRIAGIVYDPFRDELYSASKDRLGAYLNGRRIETSKKARAVDALVATCFPNDRWQKWDIYWPVIDRLIMNCRNVRAFGAAALDICWVACSRLDGFFEYNLKPWDVAAASFIAEQAGGTAVSFNASVAEAEDKEFSIFAKSFLITGAGLFSELRKIVGGS